MTDALNNTIINAVIRAIRSTLFLPESSPIGPETRLSEDLMLDSLGLIEITMSLEETYSTTFPIDLAPRFRCVADLVSYLSRRYFPDDVACLRASV